MFSKLLIFAAGLSQIAAQSNPQRNLRGQYHVANNSTVQNPQLNVTLSPGFNQTIPKKLKPTKIYETRSYVKAIKDRERNLTL
jgi:hypothetical protein